MPREQVVLNIYDLHDNSWLYHLGIGGHRESATRSLHYTHSASAGALISCCTAGIFHSGVQVYGVVSPHSPLFVRCCRVSHKCMWVSRVHWSAQEYAYGGLPGRGCCGLTALYQACCSKYCSNSRERLPVIQRSVQGMSTI